MGRIWWSGLLLVLLCAGLFMGLRPPLPVTLPQAALLWPGLDGQQAQVQQLELRRGVLPAVLLQRQGAGWVLPAAAGYPARAVEVESLLLALGSARRLEPRTASVENHAQLGLAEQGEGGALHLTLTLAGQTRTLLIGNLSARGGQLVRWRGDPQVWLIDRSLQTPASELAWLDRRISSIPFSSVQRLRIQRPDAPLLQLSRTDPQADLTVEPPGRSLPAAEANAMAGLFARFEAADLLPTSQLTFRERPLLQLQLECFGGGQLSASIHRRGEHYWLLPGEAHGLGGQLYWQSGWAYRIEAQQYQLLAR